MTATIKTTVIKEATSATDNITLDSSGNVGIGNSSPTYKLTIGSPTTSLGTTAGDTVDFTRLHADDANADYLDFKINRNSDGSDWTSANWSIQRTVDVTPMGYISFGSQSSDLITFGKSTTEYFRIGGSGQIGIGGANYGTSGQVLTSGGSGAAPSWADAAGGGLSEVREIIFDSSGTYTPNTSANFYQVVCIGGGQGGEASNSGTGDGGNGAGGAIVGFTPAQMGSTAITVTIGAGGGGGNNTVGSVGGDSSFGSYITCLGGGNVRTATVNVGTANVNQTGNVGSTASGYSIRPYSGPTGFRNTNFTGGNAAPFGTPGVHASLPGSGGGGGFAKNANTVSLGKAAPGGSGGAGIVIVKEYF